MLSLFFGSCSEVRRTGFPSEILKATISLEFFSFLIHRDWATVKIYPVWQTTRRVTPIFFFQISNLEKEKHEVKLDINGELESVYYRIVPCGGVKRCGQHAKGCPHVVPTFAVKPCCNHPDSPLQHSGECAVEFVYVWPEHGSDNRRWLTGILRSGDLQSNNLHTHPLHKEMKIPVKVDTDIHRAVIDNPHLKPSDLTVGMYVS